MMVAASALYERQTHDLDAMQKENSQLKQRVDGFYATESSRTVGEKSKATEQLDRGSVEPAQGPDIWLDFAHSVSRF